jgi:hypothetical protein
MKLIKKIPRPDTDKYQSWPGDWGIYKCPNCGKNFNAPIYGVSKGIIKSCGCLRKQQGISNLKKFWKKSKKHPNGNYVTIGNETLNITEWSIKTGIPRSTIKDRYNRGLKPEEILKEYYESQSVNKH